MSLLPSRDPDVDGSQDGEIRIRGLADEDDVDLVLDALSSETARNLLLTVHDDPGTPSELAERADTSIQNVSYHLSNLEDAGLVRVAGTRYSEKGQEMKVYAPARNPTAIFVGTEERESRFRRLVSRFLGAIAVLALASILVHRLVVGDLPFFDMAAAGGAGGGSDPAIPVATAVFAGGFLTLLALWAWHAFAEQRRVTVAWIRGSPRLAGADPRVAARSLRVATAATCLLAVGWGALGSLGGSVPDLGPFDVFRDGAILLALVAAVHAYRNRGLFVCWALAGLPVVSLGAYFAANGLAVLGALGYALFAGGLAGIVLGSAGFVVGSTVRLLRRPIG